MVELQRHAPEPPSRRTARRAVLALTLLFILAAVSVSAGLVAYTPWLHDLRDGLFAVLSAKPALSWLLWQGHEDDPSTSK